LFIEKRERLKAPENDVSGEPVRWRIARLRGQIAELGATIGQLGQSGLDSATAQLLISQARRIKCAVTLIPESNESVSSPIIGRSSCRGNQG
jgi:hypothetical protein